MSREPTTMMTDPEPSRTVPVMKTPLGIPVNQLVASVGHSDVTAPVAVITNGRMKIAGMITRISVKVRTELSLSLSLIT